MSEIKCPNCGAMIDPHEPKCPYCDYINPSGAQEKYMQKMEQNRLRLDNVDEEAAELYHKEMKKRGKRLAITIGVTVAVILLGILAYALKEHFFGYSAYELTPEEQIKEIAWQKENFPKLDELYNAGRYDELTELYFSLIQEGSHEIWLWDHYFFLDCLVNYSLLTDNMESYPGYVRDGNYSAASSVLFYTAKFYYRDYDYGNSLSESDRAYVETLRDQAVTILHDKLCFSDEDMETLRPELCGKGYVDSRACEKAAKKYFDRFTY